MRTLLILTAGLAFATGPLAAQTTYNTVALSGSSGTALGLGPNLGAGVNFSSFNTPALDASGRVAFLGVLTGTGVTAGLNDHGIWTNVGGTLTAVARNGAGGPGPNLGPGLNFETINFDAPVLNAGGVAFTGTLIGIGTIGGSHDRGVWTNASGTLTAVASAGTNGPGPNLGAGVYFRILIPGNFSNPVLNGAGRVAFKGFLAGTGVNSTNDTGIWTDASGTLTAVARTGAGGPGPNLGTGVNFSNFGNPVLNASGSVAFSGILTGTGVDSTNDSGIWTNVSGTLTAVAREGAGGPGPNLGAGINFAGFRIPVINASGSVAFVGFLTGTAANNSGIWTNASGTLTIVARRGTGGPGPNLGAGVNFNDFGTPVLNASGSVAFVGVLSGTGVTTANDRGIWTNAGGTLNCVVREGDLFDVDPGAGTDMRTISTINFIDGGGGEDGRGVSFNDSNMLTFGLNFTDGTSGIFTAQLTPIPEPSVLLLAAGLGLLAVRRRRARPATR